MFASVVLAAMAAAGHPAGVEGAELHCSASGGAALRLWRGDAARPARVLERAAPGGTTFVVTLSSWSVQVLPLNGSTRDFGLQVIDDSAPGRLRSSTTLLSCDGAGVGAVKLRQGPGEVTLASVDQAKRLR